MTNVRLVAVFVVLAVVIASWALTCAAGRADRVIAGVAPLDPRTFARFTLVTLGTGGAYENPNRAGPCIALALGDEIALVETVGSGDRIYSTNTVGPDGTYVPGHSYACPDMAGWKIGDFTLGVTDTPDGPNPGCLSPAPEFADETRDPCAPVVSQTATVVRLSLYIGIDIHGDIQRQAIVYRLSPPYPLRLPAETMDVGVAFRRQNAANVVFSHPRPPSLTHHSGNGLARR